MEKKSLSKFKKMAALCLAVCMLFTLVPMKLIAAGSEPIDNLTAVIAALSLDNPSANAREGLAKSGLLDGNRFEIYHVLGEATTSANITGWPVDAEFNNDVSSDFSNLAQNQVITFTGTGGETRTVQYIQTGHVTVNVNGNGTVEMDGWDINNPIVITSSTDPNGWFLDLDKDDYTSTPIPGNGYELCTSTSVTTGTDPDLGVYTLETVRSDRYVLTFNFVSTGPTGDVDDLTGIIGGLALHNGATGERLGKSGLLSGTRFEVYHVRGDANNSANIEGWPQAPAFTNNVSDDFSALTQNQVITFTGAGSATRTVQYIQVGRVEVTVIGNGTVEMDSWDFQSPVTITNLANNNWWLDLGETDYTFTPIPANGDYELCLSTSVIPASFSENAGVYTLEPVKSELYEVTFRFVSVNNGSQPVNVTENVNDMTELKAELAQVVSGVGNTYEFTIDATFDIDEDITIPEDVTLIIGGGFEVNITNGAVLEINGGVLEIDGTLVVDGGILSVGEYTVGIFAASLFMPFSIQLTSEMIINVGGTFTITYGTVYVIDGDVVIEGGSLFIEDGGGLIIGDGGTLTIEAATLPSKTAADCQSLTAVRLLLMTANLSLTAAC
jgi:hypothetical protein